MTEHTLVHEALHLPKHEARRWRHTMIDQEDLVADGYVGLVKAARRFDPSRGVPFPVFARYFVRGAIVDSVRHAVRRHRLADGVYADVRAFSELAVRAGFDEARGYDPPDPGPSPHEAAECRDALRAVVALPERERIALVRTTVVGDTADDVARDLGVSAHRVYTLAATGSARARKRAA